MRHKRLPLTDITDLVQMAIGLPTSHGFGPELLTNASFASASAPPTVGSGVSALPGPLTCTNVSTLLTWLTVCLTGHTYRVVLTYKATGGTNVRINNSTASGTLVPAGSSGTQPIVTDNVQRTITFDFVALGTTLQFEADLAVFSGTLIAASLKELT